jgi:hypothetical protein
MADFGGNALDRGGDDAERGEIHRMAVTRDHLGRDRLGGQAHGLCNMLFHARIDVGEGADGAGDGAGGDFGAGIDEAGAAAVELGVGLGHFQPEGDRLGMDAVGAADADGVLVLDGAALDGGEQRVHVGEQKVGCLDQLHIETGVENVGGGHALMDEAGIRADNLGQVGKEGDDVVLGFALDFVDAVDVESGLAALFPDGLRRLPWGSRRVRQAHRRHGPRSRTRSGTSIPATRLRPFPGGSNEVS